MSLVGIVLVSHSGKLAEGLAELASQMAPDTEVLPAGGLAEGAIGTDYDRVVDAVQRADGGRGVVLLYDLGSAQMTAELAVESLADPDSGRVVEAPFVEGAVAAAVAAQNGADLDGVASAAASAAAPAEPAPPATAGGEVESAELVLNNEVGLHARPAALLARSLAGVDAEVRIRFGVDEADAHSVLGLMSLGARKGDRIEVRAQGEQAAAAVRGIAELVERNFDEQ